MSVEPPEGIPVACADEPVAGWRPIVRESENLLVVLSLVLLMALLVFHVEPPL